MNSGLEDTRESYTKISVNIEAERVIESTGVETLTGDSRLVCKKKLVYDLTRYHESFSIKCLALSRKQLVGC